MRTTNNMLINNMVNYISTNQKRMEYYQYQLATGKKIKVPSDNPVVAARALKLRTDVAEIAQYKRNVEDAKSWMEVTETALSQIGDILHRAGELAVQAANQTYSPEETDKIKEEVIQLREQAISLANTSYNGRTIFSGFMTNEKLIDASGDYNANVSAVDASHTIKYEIGIGIDININVIGGDIFGWDNPVPPQNTIGKPPMIRDFDQFIAALDKTTYNHADISAAITNFQGYLNNVLAVRADVGARMNRLDLTSNRLEDDNLNFTGLMAKNEDVDQAETIMNLKNEENVYRAALAGGARIIQTSLIDFLR